MRITSGRYAAITSTVALLVALGGTGYAATQIGTNQIKNNAVTTPKIKANAINTGKVKDNSLNGNDINEGTLGQVPSAATAANANHADSADDADTVNGESIVAINHRSGDVTDAVLGTLNGLTVRATCVSGTESMSAITTVSDSEIGFSSVEADNLSQPGGSIDDAFNVGDVFAITNAPGSSSDRQYQIAYSAADGNSVNVFLTTEDGIGGDNCVISGYMIG